MRVAHKKTGEKPVWCRVDGFGFSLRACHRIGHEQSRTAGVEEPITHLAELGLDRRVDELVAHAELDAPEHARVGVGVHDDLFAD